MCKISIVMPAYNAEDTIQSAINSVLNQKLKDWELLVVDDGSIDGTKSVVKGFTDSRIIYISQSNSGPGTARNRGIEESEGEYIVFMDSDDIIHPCYLEVLLNNVQEMNADISMCDYIKVRRNKLMNIQFDSTLNCCKSKMELLPSEECISLMFYKRKVMPYPFLKLINRKVIGESRFPTDISLGEDLEFNLEILKKAKRIVYSPYKMYYHIENDDSITRNLRCSVASSHFERLHCLLEKEDIIFSNAIRSRLFVYAYDLLSQELKGDFDERVLKERCKLFICENRKKVFRDGNTSRIVKMMALSSFVSVPITICICKVMRRLDLKSAT